ncbi:kinase-like domain-containing protein [Hygrophoropsis aurantiaca]|uniref:Kinase-like domain-containing protein n=1 Tax=Hygrophoropsis aurantiaca TaxID=72124 RepID=A0ACB8AFY7_9AGAM|nr:kinase-like domain-containing protein [Hygrophoropsis aurantiaca]
MSPDPVHSQSDLGDFSSVQLPNAGPPPKGEILHSFFHRSVLQISDTRVLKLGADITPGEADMMHFVKKHVPSVPCPTVHSVEVYEEGPFPKIGIFMDRVPGSTLEAIWPSASDQAKDSYIAQLRELIQRLREPTGQFLGKIGHRACMDPGGFGVNDSCMGPFDDEESFNRYRLERVRVEKGDDAANRVASLQKSGHRFVLTHGDLSGRNIFVKDGKITGLVDWESSGWYPEYWEWIQAQTSPSHDSCWRQVLGQVLEPYPEMLELEELF